MIPFRLSKQDATLTRRCHGRMTGKQPLLGTSGGQTFAAVAPFERSFGSRRTSLVQEFCADNGFEDGELVYEDKMI
jgi:hypothetical protein